jgi:hypothetical protein
MGGLPLRQHIVAGWAVHVKCVMTWLNVINIIVIWCVNKSSAVFFNGNQEHKTETYRVLIVVQCPHIDPWVWRHPTLQSLPRVGRHNTSRNLNHCPITTDVKNPGISVRLLSAHCNPFRFVPTFHFHCSVVEKSKIEQRVQLLSRWTVELRVGVKVTPLPTFLFKERIETIRINVATGRPLFLTLY